MSSGGGADRPPVRLYHVATRISNPAPAHCVAVRCVPSFTCSTVGSSPVTRSISASSLTLRIRNTGLDAPYDGRMRRIPKANSTDDSAAGSVTSPSRAGSVVISVGDGVAVVGRPHLTRRWASRDARSDAVSATRHTRSSASGSGYPFVPTVVVYTVVHSMGSPPTLSLNMYPPPPSARLPTRYTSVAPSYHHPISTTASLTNTLVPRFFQVLYTPTASCHPPCAAPPSRPLPCTFSG